MNKYKTKIFLLELLSVAAIILGGYIYAYPAFHQEVSWGNANEYTAVAIWILTCIAVAFAVARIHPPEIVEIQLYGVPHIISAIPTVTDAPRGSTFIKADLRWYYFQVPDGSYCKLKK